MKTQKTLLQTIADWQATRQSPPGASPSSSPNRAARLLRWLTPNGGTIILILLLVFTQNIWATPLQRTANAPGPSANTINYQGRLADSGGNPQNGAFSMTFALYDAATDGNLLWSEDHTAVPVSDGLFSVGLGSQTSIPTTVWNGDVYLEVTVGSEILSPRELIRSVPIAGIALTVPDGTIGSSQIADGAIVSSEIANGAVGASKIANGAIGSSKIANNAVVSSKIANGAVTKEKLNFMQNGKVSSGTASGKLYRAQTVVFQTPFTSAPVIVATSGDLLNVVPKTFINVIRIQNNRFEVRWYKQDGSAFAASDPAVEAHWIAIAQ